MNAFTSKTALLAETLFCFRSSLFCPHSLGLNQRLHSPSESVRTSPPRFELSGAFCCLLLLKISNCIHNSREKRNSAGPKEWLKEQKKKSSKFLLAPIDASRESLRAAYLILTKASESTTDDLEEVQRLFRSAARDCVAEDRNSFVAFQANTGVEVCTFKLIVKNAASLLADKDPVKLEAEAMLGDLIRSFSSLNGLTSTNDLQDMTYRERVADALTDTISSLDKFEQGIKDCLEI